MASPKIPTTFTPRVFEELDGRLAVVKRIKERISQLLRLATSKHPLCKQWAQRAAFAELQISSLECEALSGDTSKAGTFAQLANLLERLYDRLGIEEPAADNPEDKLARHLEGRQ